MTTQSTPPGGLNRRPLTSRDTSWAIYLSKWIARHSLLTPNQISCCSIVFALLGAIILLWWVTPISLVLCAVCIQLRLLCNLLDGMVAVEEGKKTSTGALYNEMPDRIADSLLIVALGYAVDTAWLGWLAALLAMFTAYIRVLGGSLGLAQAFSGPMAKPHRMATQTIACVIGAIEVYVWQTSYVLLAGLVIITVGAALTCILRTHNIAKNLQ